MTRPRAKAEKYARTERERRFLLSSLPDDPAPVRVARITDRYITGSRLRLRHSVERTITEQVVVQKLTQKIPAPDGRPGLITTLYLSDAEYAVISALDAHVLHKTRYSIPPFGIDVFDTPLDGLLLAEIEFDSDEAEDRFSPPPWSVAEVTADPRFTGGRLVLTHRDEVQSWLAEFGIFPPS